MNQCENCNACREAQKVNQNGPQMGYVKFKGDKDDGMWFHGLVFQRAQNLTHLPREEAMKRIRKEFGISP